MTSTPRTIALPTIAELADAITELDQLDDVERIAAARRLAETITAHLAAHADQWTYDATRTMSQQTLAMRLGITKSAIERAITRVNHRMRQTTAGARGLVQLLEKSE